MPAPRQPVLARLGRQMVRRRRAVLASWVLALVLALGLGPRIAGDFTVDYGTPGSDSLAALELLEDRFPDSAGQTLLLTWRSEEADATAEGKVATARADKVLAQLGTIPGIDAQDASEPRYSPDERTAVREIPLSKRPANIAHDDGPALMAIVDGASRATVRVRMGGIVIQEAQAKPISSEGVGLTIALLILLVTFGTVVAAGLPIATALFGIGTGSALVGLVAAFIDTPAWAESVAAMIGIGVGIDYALLILTRHRANLRSGAAIEDSIAHALSTAGMSVLVAGGTVVISLLGLLFMQLPYLEGVAITASLSVLVVLIASLTLLPALLGFAGARIDALRVPGVGRTDDLPVWTPERGAPTPADQSPRFARWTAIVQRNAWTATLASLVLVAVLTAPVAGVRLGFPGSGTDPVGSQTREAYDQVTDAFGPGVVGPLHLVVPLEREGDRKRVARLRTRIAKDDRVAGVAKPVYSEDGSTARLDVQSRTEPESTASAALLERLRTVLIPRSGLGGVLVGGYTAETHDQASATERRLPILFLGVAGLSGILLLIAFRSIVVPIKAGLMNLFSIAAAYGIVAFVAEGGAAGALVGIDASVPIPPFIPVLMFAVLFGLSMDYEVFLVGRIREYWAAHGDAERAVVEGVAATGRVITAAAAIMVAVFGAFALSDQIILKLIGIGMASAILIDATVIRLVLVPALMTLMGKNNWWLPGWLDRIVPQTELEGPQAGPEPEPTEPLAPPRVPVTALPPLLRDRPADWADAAPSHDDPVGDHDLDVDDFEYALFADDPGLDPPDEDDPLVSA